MVEVTPLPVEDIGVGIGAEEGFDQVGEASILDGGDRVFHGVGVVVADHQDIGITRAGWVGGEPVHQFGRGVDAHLIAVALSIACIRRVTGSALALEVVDIHDEDLPVGVLLGRPAPAMGGCAGHRRRH